MHWSKHKNFTSWIVSNVCLLLGRDTLSKFLILFCCWNLFFRKVMPPRSVWMPTTMIRAGVQPISRDIRTVGNTGWVYVVGKKFSEVIKTLGMLYLYMTDHEKMKCERDAGKACSPSQRPRLWFPGFNSQLPYWATNMAWWASHDHLFIGGKTAKILVLDTTVVTPTGWLGCLHNEGSWRYHVCQQ